MAGLNQYTQLLYYIKQLADGDNYINTVTKGDNVELDKITIFPLLHIDINNASFPSEGTISFGVELSCMAIRDINNEVNTSRMWGQDNVDDNLNETLAALNRIWSIMKRGFVEHNITASSNPTLDAHVFSGKNLLDGWQMNFEVEMPNIAISLCDEIC